MRVAAVVIVVGFVAACGGRSVPPAPTADPRVPRLLAPPLIDPDAPGAAYLTAVALSLQPAWHQFLEDCRLRLPATHPLNRMDRTTTAQLTIGRRGELVELRVAVSGSTDFDHAIEQVVHDASPLPPPPRELWSDDDQVHLVWTFARDRRQAGPATAKVIEVELPLRGVVDRRIGEHDLARAARRILRDKPSADREIATQRLMIAALREALESSDTSTKAAALEAIGAARATELAMEVRQVLQTASDLDVRRAAIGAVRRLDDDDAALILMEQLREDLRERAPLALAEAQALAEMSHTELVKPLLAGHLANDPPNVTALRALAFAPIDELAPFLPSWLTRGTPRVRAAACAALAGYSRAVAAPLVLRGLGDRDATVRAACLEAAIATPAIKKRVAELVKDRDSIVRARALAAHVALGGKLDGALADAALNDRAIDVRVAFALAKGVDARPLLDDRDPDVRAAAWAAFAAPAQAPPGRSELAVRAATDPAPQVRRVAIRAIEDDDLLAKISTSDDDRDVRTTALLELARRRGRAGIADALLERLADAPPGSGERVRTALAWLLAR